MRTLDETIAYRIRDVLKDKGWSPYTLSQRSGIASGYLTELLNLHPKKRWNTDTLDKVAQALNVPVWYFFVDPDSVYPEKDRNIVKLYTSLNVDDRRIVDGILQTSTGNGNDDGKKKNGCAA